MLALHVLAVNFRDKIFSNCKGQGGQIHQDRNSDYLCVLQPLSFYLVRRVKVMLHIIKSIPTHKILDGLSYRVGNQDASQKL